MLSVYDGGAAYAEHVDGVPRSELGLLSIYVYIYIYIYIHIDREIYTHVYVYIYIYTHVMHGY